MTCNVKLIAITKPMDESITTAEGLITYCARVSNPTNQNNTETSDRLIRYLIKNKHFSPFEQVYVTLEIETTRDIGRQILRHRSFVFQEFSQRYSVASNFSELREARIQDEKNRQNSVDTNDEELQTWWSKIQQDTISVAYENYNNALTLGIAKEQARAILPEGLTMTKMYMTGSVRSWIHYCELRCGNGTQKEHREVAVMCRDIVSDNFPNVACALGWT